MGKIRKPKYTSIMSIVDNNDLEIIKRIVTGIYLAFGSYFVCVFYANNVNIWCAVLSAISMIVSVVLCTKKFSAKTHGIFMALCMFFLTAIFSAVSHDNSEIIGTFLSISIVISLYQMFSLNVFLIIATSLYALLSAIIPDSIIHDNYESITELIVDEAIIIIANIVLMVLIKWNRQMIVKLNQKTQEAEMAAINKSEFLANMSHEIRNPLNGIVGMNELVLRESRQPHIKEYAMYIKNSSMTMLTIINDILDFSKIEQGKLSIREGGYKLSALIQEIERDMQKYIMEKNLALKIYIAPTIHDNLYGDQVRIKQIITNLLTNAVKYTEKGQVRLYITGSTADGKETLTMEVSDTGIGISKENLEKIFASFERVDSQSTRGIDGFGLGLAITKKLLDTMGGTIKVTSAEGEGSTFTVTLSQGITDETLVGDYHQRFNEQMNKELEYQETFHADGAKILVVDDNIVNLKIIEGFAKHLNVKADTVTSAKEAIGLIKKHHYHMLFIDHLMPEMDGLQMLRSVKSMDDGIYAGIPAIVITANAISDAKEMYIAAGFNGYLSKPVDSKQFEDMLHKYIPEKFIREMKDGVEQEKTAKGNTARLVTRIVSDEPLDIHIKNLDTNVGLNYLNGDQTGYVELLQTFISDSNARLSDIHRSFAAGNLENYIMSVHALKSATASIGAMKLSSMAAEIEASNALNNSPHLAMMAEYGRLSADLKNWFANKDTSGKMTATAASSLTDIYKLLEHMKTAIYAYRHKEATGYLKQLFVAENPQVKETMGAKYSGALDRIYRCLSNYDMDSAYEEAAKLEKDLRRMGN